MKFSLYRVLIVLVILFQIGWLLSPNLNTLSDLYRYDERQKALETWIREKTPESKAAADVERHLLHVHWQHKALLISGLFLVVDGILIHYFWNYGQRKASA